MTEQTILYGCAPDPLLHYLKALGVMRLVAEQLDPMVRAAWLGDSFVIETSKTKDQIIAFFLNDYSPTPIVAPWNGSSGFYPADKKQRDMFELLGGNDCPRFDSYRRTVAAAQAIVGERPSQPREEEKAEMLRAARRTFPEVAVDWLDAAFVLGREKPDYLPLLGSGGNDGRLDFTVNFAARLLAVLPEFLAKQKQPQEKIRLSTDQLHAALFSNSSVQLEKASVGQFHPAGAGGANAEQGFTGDSFVNPWDFILAIEGSLLMASAAVRQLTAGARTKASFPFTVRSSNIGYGTATDGEKIRAELWLPLWSRFSPFLEVAHIFREGRVQFSNERKIVRTGFDFARAVAELGVDRGIESFQRYAFIERNGQSNLATPLGKFDVYERPLARLIHQIDPWLESFGRSVSGDKAPPRFVLANKRTENAIFDLCQSDANSAPDRLLEVLICLGGAEAELAAGEKFRDEKSLRPLSGLSMGWVRECEDASTEFNLAMAVASIGDRKNHSIRQNLEPVEINGKLVKFIAGSVQVVWGNDALEENLAAVLQRRSIDAPKDSPSVPVLNSSQFASLVDVASFLDRSTDDVRIEELLRGLVLIDWTDSRTREENNEVPPELPRAYALLKLLFLPGGKFQRDDQSEIITIKHEPAILPLLRAQRVSEALGIAHQRLLASGLIPLSKEFHYDDAEGTRLAASLLIPINEWSARKLASMVLRDHPKEM